MQGDNLFVICIFSIILNLILVLSHIRTIASILYYFLFLFGSGFISIIPSEVTFGRKLKNRIKYSFILSPNSLIKWHRILVRRRWTYNSSKIGRPSIPEEIEKLIVRIATETGWGYPKIKGELKKLGYKVSETTIKKEYINYFNFARPHQGINNQIPERHNQPYKVKPTGKVSCRKILGGIIKDYFRVPLVVQT